MFRVGWYKQRVVICKLIFNFYRIFLAMLLSQQEEQYKYFYIDRKFVSGNLQLIHEALDEIDLFLGKMKKIDLINSLILRMVDLIGSTKSLVLKHRVASIFKHHQHLLLTIHCRDEVANSLVKYIKANDELTRLVTLQIISKLSTLFLRDIAVYHILLSKLAQNNSLSKVQKKEAIICLAIILVHSPQIAKLFARNVNSLKKSYAIPLHIILYLLSHVPLDSHLQVTLLEELAKLITAEQSKQQKWNSKHRKEVAKYLEKLVVSYAQVNYKVVQFYEKKLRQKLPKIAEAISKIKRVKYSFLLGEMEPEHETLSQKFEQLIDQVYIKKVSGQLLKQGQHYNQKLYSLIDDALLLNQGVQKIVLLFYFIEDISHYDRILKKKITAKYKPIARTFLKQLIVVGCFETALFLLHSVDLPQTNYLFLKTYLEFKLQKQPKKIDELKQIAQVLNQSLFQVVKAWQLIDKLLKLWLATSSPNLQLVKQLKSMYVLGKDNEEFAQLSNIIKVFVDCKQNENPQSLKNRCFPYLPSIIMNTNNFWFAHINKQTVITLFDMAL